MTEISSAARSCADCAAIKPLTEFYRYKTGAPYNRCKPCHYSRTQKWRNENRERLRELERTRYRVRYLDKIKSRKRFQKYGITQDDYERLLEMQGGVCAICLEPFDESGPSSSWGLASVDHDHETGLVRGVLHRRCNLALEFLLSDENIDRARAYLGGSSPGERLKQSP